MKQKERIRLIAFVLLCLTLISLLPHCLKASDENRNTPSAQEFLEEAYNSLDGVFIGSSYVYSYWEPPLAWEDNGIAVYSYASSAMSMEAVQHIISSCRATQPDALYIVEVKSLIQAPRGQESQHSLFDYMLPSAGKFLAIHECCRDIGIEWQDEVELYFPLFLYHSNWGKVYDNTDATKYGLKGAVSYPLFWQQVPMTEPLAPLTAELTQKQLDTLNDLLDYCERTDLNVLFVATPGFIDATFQQEVAEVGQIITSRGFDFVDCCASQAAEQIAMDPETDYYNAGHTNIKGASKFTDFFSAYLSETYGFADKRGQSGWESWDESVTKYKDVIWDYVPERYGPRPEPGPEGA